MVVDWIRQSGRKVWSSEDGPGDDRFASVAERVAGRSTTPKHVFEPLPVFPRFRMTNMAWKTQYGRPSAQNIKKLVLKMNESIEPGGVNDHLGMTGAMYGGKVTDQFSGDVVAEWEDKGIIRDYKNRPAFQVASRRTSAVREDDFTQDDGSVDWNAYKEAQSLEIADNKSKLRKRLMEGRSVLRREYKALFKAPVFDFRNQRLVSDDGTMALQWMTRPHPNQEPSYNNQQTSVGTVSLVKVSAIVNNGR